MTALSRTDMLTLEVPGYGKVAIPVEIIARSRAAYYAHEFGGDIERSLAEDTWPLFEASPFEVQDWARNNMNWSDVAASHIRIEKEIPPGPDFQEAWLEEEMEIVSRKSLGLPEASREAP